MTTWSDFETPEVGDVWQAKAHLGYTSIYADRWGRGRLVEVVAVLGDEVRYKYLTGMLKGGFHDMLLTRFRSAYRFVGRIDDADAE